MSCVVSLTVKGWHTAVRLVATARRLLSTEDIFESTRVGRASIRHEASHPTKRRDVPAPPWLQQTRHRSGPNV